MTLPELYAALEEADRKAQAGDEEARQDAIELASMIEQFKESSSSAQEPDSVSPIIVGTATGIAAGAKGATEMLPTAENIARANRIINPPAAAPSAPTTPAATTPHGFHPGATSNAQFNAEQIEANKLLKPGNVPPGYKVEGNSRLIVPTTVDTAVKGTSPVIASKQEARQIALDKLKRGTTATGQFAGKVPGINVVTGGMAGYQGADAYNRAQRGDVPGAVVSGIGSAGSATSTLLGKKHPIARIGGLGVGLLAPVVNRAIDAQSTKEEKAMGGPVGYAGGKAVKGGLEAVKKLLSPAGKSGAQVSREASYVHDVRPSHKFSDTNKLSIEDLQGSVLVGVPGDRSLTGHTLYSVNGVPLAKPTELFGGPRYGQRKSDLGENAFWASQQGAASAFQNKVARAAEETGMPVHGIYTAMAPDSSNYALHHTEALLNQLGALNPRKKDVQSFDKIIRSEHPAFFGLNDPDVMEQLRMNPEMRKLIAERLNKRSISEVLGLPSGEATTHAITEPRLRDVATGTSGFSVGKLDPHAKLSMDIAGDHPTYNTKIPGEFRGEMIAQLPWQDYFPDVAKQIALNPKQAPHAFGTFKMGQFYQPVNQELVDRIAPLEEILRKGAKKAEGGPVGYAAGKKVIDATRKLILPPAENAARTQIIGTLPTYEKAGSILQQRGATGRGIDFGAGLGEGVKALGKDFDTYEPFAQNWKPTYSNAADVPSDEYGRLTNLNVLNVVPREVRDEIVQDIGRVMQPGGMGIITTRGKDVMNAKGLAGPEPMSVITSRDTYQKGFNKDELEEYLKYMLGDKFDINRLNLGPAGAMIKKKAEGGLACMKEGGSTPAWQRSEGKNPEGGLNAAGRASYNRETGGNLKAPQPEGGPRKKSFCARMEGMKKKNTSSATANDPDSRINKSLRKWKC
jgi:hypothetical protein